jgi:serine/threonine protein kinase
MVELCCLGAPSNTASESECRALLAQPSPLSMMRSPCMSISPNSTATPNIRRMKRKNVGLTPSRYAGYTGSDYEQEAVIGRGAFGLVALVRPTGGHAPTQLYAMKTVDRFRLTSNALRKSISREIRIQSELPPHEGIVPLVEVIEDQRSIHMVFEYASGGTVSELVSEVGPLGETDARLLTLQVCKAVAHLHTHHTCHRDVKLDNLMLDGTGRPDHHAQVGGAAPAARPLRVRLIDFGLSVAWREGDPPLTKLAGSLCYMAPEIQRVRGGYSGVKVDAWSVGCCVAAMLGGELPFQADDDETLRRLIRSGAYSLPTRPTLSSAALDLVAQMLTLAPEERLGVADAQAHEWLTGEEGGPHMPSPHH